MTKTLLPDMHSAERPNFFVIGAHKAGTTSVYHYLSQHPEIFMSPVKEPRFFAFVGDSLDYTGPRDPSRKCPYQTPEAYLGLFTEAAPDQEVGEASTVYLYHPEAPRRIRQEIPSAKIIAILRQPVDRAYSNFLHCRRDGQEPLEDFVAALEAEAERIEKGWGSLWHYASKGRYAEQLRRYLSAFPEDQVSVYLFDNLVNDPKSLMQDIYRFLDVDSEFRPDTARRYNVSGLPKSQWLHHVLRFTNPLKKLLAHVIPRPVGRRILARLKQLNLDPAPDLSERTRRRITRRFREEILELQELIDLDLSHWLYRDSPQ